MAWNTKIPHFRRFVLQNFPFIEEDFDALTDYQLISKVVEYLNKVITSQNEVIQQMIDVTANFEQLESLFNQLKDYVDHYFDNLDVQEEINNKLDEMAEQGVLADIISQYLNSVAVFGYDTVASMKSSVNLIDGSYARTLGYYAKNDGGGALYKIRTITNDDVIDEAFIIEMGDGTDELVAELVIDYPLDIRKLGCKGDNTTNNHDRVQKAITKGIELYIGDGIYYCGNEITTPASGITISGGHTPNYYVDATDSVLRFDNSAFSDTHHAPITLNNIVLKGSGKVEGSWNATHALKDIRGTIRGCTITGFKYAIQHCGTLNLSQSHIYGNDVGIYQTADSIIHDNDIYSNDSHGYHTDGGLALNTLTGNRFEWNGGCGVKVESSNNNTITNNVFDRNGLQGVLVSSCINNIINSNMFKRNYASDSTTDVTHANLMISSAYNTIITGNSLSYGKQNDGGTGDNVPSIGIRMNASHNCYVIGNEISAAGVDENISRSDVSGSTFIQKELIQSVGNHATDLDSCILLANKLKVALIALNLVKQ